MSNKASQWSKQFRRWLEHLERAPCALLIPSVLIKSCVIASLLLEEDFHFSASFMDWMPVAYFQLMYSRVPRAHCVSCRQSFLVSRPLAPIIMLPLCLHDLLSWQSTRLHINTKKRLTMHLNLRKLLRLVGRAKPFTLCQHLNPSVNTSALLPLLLRAWC